MCNSYLGNYKKKWEKNLYPFNQEARKTKCWVQVDLHYALKVPKLLFTPVCAQGGPLDPTIFKYFPVRISVRNLHHIRIHLEQPLISKKNIQKCSVSKWRPKNDFSFRENSHVIKIWKPLFQKNFSMKFGSK